MRGDREGVGEGGRNGAAHVMIYKAVAQSVILYGSES